MIIIVFGLPGSGKSYFASRLAAAISAGYINSDIERKKMLSIKTYSPEEKFFVYEGMVELMKEYIKENKNLVLDATFYKKGIRQRFLDEAGDTPVVFIEVFTNEEITRQRLGKKREDSDADFNVYTKIKEEWEPLLTQHLTLESTNDNIGDMIGKAVEYIKTKTK